METLDTAQAALALLGEVLEIEIVERCPERGCEACDSADPVVIAAVASAA